jgi:hypothetical protein
MKQGKRAARAMRSWREPEALRELEASCLEKFRVALQQLSEATRPKVTISELQLKRLHKLLPNTEDLQVQRARLASAKANLEATRNVRAEPVTAALVVACASSLGGTQADRTAARACQDALLAVENWCSRTRTPAAVRGQVLQYLESAAIFGPGLSPPREVVKRGRKLPPVPPEDADEDHTLRAGRMRIDERAERAAERAAEARLSKVRRELGRRGGQAHAVDPKVVRQWQRLAKAAWREDHALSVSAVAQKIAPEYPRTTVSDHIRDPKLRR